MNRLAPALLTAHDIDAWDALSDLEALALAQDPHWWLRPDQWPPHSDWRQLGMICGRSSGKSYACASIITDLVNEGKAKTIALSAQDLDNGYSICVESLLTAAPISNRARLFRDRIEWDNGARAYVFTPESADAPRGYNLDAAWLTEVAAYHDRDGVDLYDNINSALRDAGGDEHLLWDTTPKGSSALLAKLIRMSELDPVGCPILRATTFVNPFNSKAFIQGQVRAYGVGTRKYREEILAEVFDGSEGALWQRAWIDNNRVATAPPLLQVVVGYDPGASEYRDADASGIVVGGADSAGHLYVVGDYSAKHSISSVRHVVFDAYLRHRANGVIAERNRGVAFVVENLRAAAKDRDLRINVVPPDQPFPERHDPNVVNVKEITSRGQKLERAEPVVALYSQNLVHHVGDYSALEREQLTYDGTGKSPNAFDAANMALSELANLRTGHEPQQTERRMIAEARMNDELQRRVLDRHRSRSVL